MPTFTVRQSPRRRLASLCTRSNPTGMPARCSQNAGGGKWYLSVSDSNDAYNSIVLRRSQVEEIKEYLEAWLDAN